MVIHLNHGQESMFKKLDILYNMAHLLNKMPDELIEHEENPILPKVIYNTCLLEQTRLEITEINNEIASMKKTIEKLTDALENINERI